jgi:hypothetical protein
MERSETDQVLLRLVARVLMYVKSVLFGIVEYTGTTTFPWKQCSVRHSRVILFDILSEFVSTLYTMIFGSPLPCYLFENI